MKRMIAVAVGVLIVVVLLAGCGGGGSDETATPSTPVETDSGATGNKLAGVVGPGFDISVDGKTAVDVTAGTYTLVIDDKSDQHNFHLTGPGGVDVSTEVSATGTKTETVKLEAGTYTFVCDPHASSMKGTITVS